MEDVFDSLKKARLDTPRGPVVYWISRCDSPLTLVFLHGVFGDHSLFVHQIRAFQGKYNLLCWDGPAHGQSRPCTVHTFLYDASDLHQILGLEGLPSPVLIAHGMGGAVARAYVRSYAPRGLVCLGTPPFDPEFYRGFPQWLLWQSQWMAVLYGKSHLVRTLARLGSATEPGRQKLEALLNTYSRQELLRILTMGTAGFLKENRKIPLDLPCQLLIGREDRLKWLRSYTALWGKELPLGEIPRAGHICQFENPEAVNRELEGFLQKLKLSDSVRP